MPAKIEIDESLLREMAEGGASTLEISTRLGCSRQVILRTFAQLGITPARKNKSNQLNNALSESVLRGMVASGMSIPEIAKSVGCGSSSVCRAMQKYGVDGIKTLNNFRMVNEQELRRLYYDEDLKLKDIAKAMGFSYGTIGRAIEHYGLEHRISVVTRKSWCTKENFEQWHHAEQRTCVQIAEMLGVSDSTVQYWLHYFSIEIRSYRPKTEPKVTIGRKEGYKKISEAKKKLWQDPEYRARMSEMSKRTGADPERRKQLSERNRERWQNPEYRARMIQHMETNSRKPERRKRASENLSKMWHEGNHAEAVLKSVNNKPGSDYRTDIESLTEAALQRLGVPYIFEHHVDYYSIDFFLPDHNIAIECDGEYWHKGEAREKQDRRRDGYLRKKGITVIRLWGKDIKRDVDTLLNWKLLPYLMAQ